MTDWEYESVLSECVQDGNYRERSSWSSLVDTCSRTWIDFLSPIFSICWIYLFSSGEATLQKGVMNQAFVENYSVVQPQIFSLVKTINQIFFYEKLRRFRIG